MYILSAFSQPSKRILQFGLCLTAIQGENFCSSARKAFSTLVSNVLRVAAINSVGDFILFLAKITVMAGTALAGVVMLKVSESSFTVISFFTFFEDSSSLLEKIVSDEFEV